MKLRPCAVFDLDGTLSDARHRLFHLRGPKPDWESFFVLGEYDPPFDYAVRIALALEKSYSFDVAIVTARPERNRSITERWLRRHLRNSSGGPAWERLLMRADGDMRPNPEVKLDLVAELPKHGLQPVFAVDDDSRVVAAYRAAGLACLEVDPGHEWIEAPRVHSYGEGM